MAKRLLCLSFFYGIGIAYSLTPLATEKLDLCILSFSLESAPIFQNIKKIFKSSKKKLALVPLAKPTDIINCIKKNASEIIIVGHSSPQNKDSATLYYIKETPFEKAESIYSEILGKLNKKILALKLKGVDLSPRYLWPQSNLRAAPTQDQKDLLKYTYQQRQISRRIENRLPYYQHLPVLDRIFELALSSTPSSFLKKIRIMACLPRQLLNRYKSLKEAAPIEIEFAPVSKTLSFLYQYQGVVSMGNRRWLEESK